MRARTPAFAAAECATRGMKCGRLNCAWKFCVYGRSTFTSMPKRPPCEAIGDGQLICMCPSVVFQPRTAYAEVMS